MFEIIVGGCGTSHPSTYRMSRPLGLPHYVLLIIRTHGIFQIQEKHYDVTPGHALIIEPNTPYFYGNPNGEYIDDWLQFRMLKDGIFEEIRKDAFPVNEPFPVNNTEMFNSIIRQILWENSYGYPDFAPNNIDLLFQVILNYLHVFLPPLAVLLILFYSHLI